MKRKQFTFYSSYYEAVKVLPKREQATVLLAICGYALNEEEPHLSGTADAIFSLIKPTLDASRRKSENGQKGGKQNGSKTEANCKQTASKSYGENKKEKEVEVENELEGENECSSPPCGGPPSPAKPVRHKYGEYENVLLSDDDLEKLKAEFPDWKARIERLSEHIASRGTVYKSHLATIRSWARRDKEGVVSPVRPVAAGRKETGFQTSNPFLEMLEERRQAK